MKKKTIRGMALGLAATSIIATTSGCSKKEVSIPKTASIVSEDADNVYEDYTYYTGGTYVYRGQEYKEAHDPSSEYVVNEYTGISYEDGLNTSSLFFVRINGKIYLATKLVDVNETNIISKFYSIDTGEFLGQTLDINWYARAAKDIDTLIPPGGDKTVEYKVSVDDDCKDINYFNGEYGLGKNLCKENIISATSLFKEGKLTKEQIDNLLVDSLLTSSIVEKYLYSSFTSYSREDYNFIPLRYSSLGGIITDAYTVGFNGNTSTYLKDMWQITIEDGDTTRTIIGYRASINQKDNGFNYIYDIESSSYINLSQFKVIDSKKMVGSITVEEIRKRFNNSQSLYYFADNLKLISTINLEGDDVFEKYYIVSREEQSIGGVYRYETLGDNEFVAISGNYDGTSLCIVKNSSLKITPVGSYEGMMISLKKCLEMNGLSIYFKDTYSEEELSILLTKLRSKELDLGVPLSETTEMYKKININDIVVIDTNKESGDSVLAQSEKRYYVLIPHERPANMETENLDVAYYEICDHTGFASISFERKFILIDNILKTHYAVLKTDGELECVSSFENILMDLGLEDCIREEYALIDLQILADRINEKQKVLVLN